MSGKVDRMSRAELEQELLACRKQLRLRDRATDELAAGLRRQLDDALAAAARERGNADRFHALLVAERIRKIPARDDLT